MCSKIRNTFSRNNTICRLPGYDEGYQAGQNAAAGMNSKSTAENEPTSKKFNKEKIWSVLNKASTVVFLVVAFVILSQVRIFCKYFDLYELEVFCSYSML